MLTGADSYNERHKVQGARLKVKIQDSAYMIQDARCRMQDTEDRGQRTDDRIQLRIAN
jgi:uncharacterized surface protein with fasciclin (FAS1) repeats